MPNFTDTRLWKTSLGQGSIEDENDPIDRLRNAFFKFRERAGQIAAEINRDLPELTVHDITHLDALWEMADLILGVGVGFDITPTEAFVLGGSFLIHDLGNGLAAYPEGINELRRNQSWKDTISALLRSRLGRHPTTEELEHPDREIEQEVTGEVLRTLHAKHAERLALISWRDQQNDQEYHLIEDIDLRRMYGQTIGRIAHSHWWPVDQLANEFPAPLGAPPGYPRDWTVDPLKMSCILRLADATHLDSRRAPGFLRALRKPSEYSRQHWIFQEHLQQPRLESERLVFTSGHAFSIDEANAWWLCYDTLNMVDRELQQVDALLADTNRARFSVKGVAGVDDPIRLLRWVPTANWIPVDTRIRVGNVASLVRNLGGEQLYGNNKLVPLRELIQNASDAVRARRIVEQRPAQYGDVLIRLGRDGLGYWLEVEDNGVGMSTNVLTGPFLDFGSSFWASSSSLTEFPGLSSSGFESTGKYGIGFFSTFMWGKRVRVTTRGYREAQRDTRVLEFKGGLSERPILREADQGEYMRDGGTCVRVWLERNPTSFNGLFHSEPSAEPQTPEEICAWLCPSIDVNLYFKNDKEPAHLIISASDWTDIDGSELFKRVRGRRYINRIRRRKKDGREQEEESRRHELLNVANSLIRNLRLVRDAGGSIVGRICISAGRLSDGDDAHPGAVTVGGFLASELTGISGILLGKSQNAARDVGVPVVDPRTLAEWASQQAQLVSSVYHDIERLQECAAIIRVCGGYTGDLPVAEGSFGWLSAEDISTWPNAPDEIVLVQDAALSNIRREFPVALHDNVLAVAVGQQSIVQTRMSAFIDWPEDVDHPLGFHAKTLVGAVVEALSRAWDKKLGEVVAASSFSRGEERFERAIGTSPNGPVFHSVYIIRKPLG